MFRRKKEMQSLIDSNRKTLADAEGKIQERNKLLEIYVKRNAELKNRIVDLENNVEFLVNNLSAKKKELVRPGNQN